MRPTQTLLVVSWTLRLTAAAILLQTLYFKFTGSPESVYIFTKVGAEPWGRLGSGVVELAAALLLIWPSTASVGGLIAAAVMAGAIGSHLTVLGIEVQGDRGLLFGLAVYVFLASVTVAALHRADLPWVGDRLATHRVTTGLGGGR